MTNDDRCPTCGGPTHEVLDSVRAVAERAAREEIALKLGGDVIFQRWQDAEQRADLAEQALIAIQTFAEQAAALAQAALVQAARRKPR